VCYTLIINSIIFKAHLKYDDHKREAAAAAAAAATAAAAEALGYLRV
jgi:hypothetical protein